MVPCPFCAGRGKVSKSAGHPLWRLTPYNASIVSCPLCSGSGEVTEGVAKDLQTIRGRWRAMRAL